MSVIVKYAIEFPKAKFNVSNDLLNDPLTEGFLIDASVTVNMKKGVDGGTFKIELFDLPEDKASELNEKAKKPGEASVVIKLGYMDGEFGTVMEGIYTKVTAQVKDDTLVTTITGEESGRYTLRTTHFQTSIEGKISFKDAVTKLLKEAFPDSGAPSAPDVLATVASLLGNASSSGERINKVPTVQAIDEDLEDISMKGESLMEILAALANKARAEFLVSDKKIHIGRPIVDTDYKPAEFDRDVNMANFRPIVENLPEEEGDNRLTKLEPHQALGFRFLVTGDPKLRPAQQVFANVETKVDGKIEGYREKNGADFRVVCLEHRLTMSGGYVCEGVAGKACSGENCRRQEVLCPRNPDSIVQGLSQRAKEERRRNPTVEIGTVKQYSPGNAGVAPHRSTLYFGQRFAGTETQPSVRAEVDAEEKQLLPNKPVASPFAWHKCGLVVPVYPGMKALLSHNLNLPDDALVTGFLWSEKPALEPPKSKEGDWWLCLPIDFNPSNPPNNGTKAANDLIANDGKRVIEVKGLKITIGKDKLASVGTRPNPGGDDEFLIEHKSGTKMQIASDGSLSIEAKSVLIKGDVTIEGNVDIK